MQITGFADCEVVRDGATTVNAGILAGIVAKAKKGNEMHFVIDGTTLIVKSGSSRFKIETLDPDGFPSMGSGELPEIITMQSTVLKTSLDRIAYAMDNDTNRYYLNGAYMHSRDGKLRLVATNGHVLALSDAYSDLSAYNGTDVIMPSKLVRFLQKALVNGDIKINLSNHKIKVESGEWSIVSKLIDGTFPDYNRVIPQSYGNEVQVSVSNLSESIARVGAVMENNNTAMAFDFGDSGLHLSMQSGGSSAEDRLQIIGEYKHQRIGLNYKLMLESLAVVNGDSVSLSYNDQATPIKLIDANGLSLVMPMRL